MNSNELAIPKESGLHMFSLLFDVTMFLTFIIYIQYANGKMGVAFTTPASGDNAVYIFFSFLSITVPILMFLFTICFSKKNLKLLLIPMMITPACYLLYEVYSAFHGDALFIVRQWYKVLSSFLMLSLFFFTIGKPKITSKLPIVITSLLLMAISILLTIAETGPFVENIPSFINQGTYYESTTIIYLSSLLQYISYQASILFLGLALTKGGIYKVTTSRKFYAMRNADKIQAINNAHRMRK